VNREKTRVVELKDTKASLDFLATPSGSTETSTAAVTGI